jgi:hypothetical protein
MFIPLKMLLIGIDPYPNGSHPPFWSPMIQSRKMSGEKVNTMKCLGAEILRTPTEAPVRLHGRPWGHVFFGSNLWPFMMAGENDET